MSSLTDRSKIKRQETRYCPVCLGLQCLERPRYFTGQLLTESELNQEQSYLLAKDRLHNLYLHGPGVVCGLEVVCHDCEGWVTVKTGYAIDPCGNDIVVCQEHPFDLIKAIRECREVTRREGRCDPFRPGADPNCQPLEEDWCVTIAYEEKEARPIATLVPDRKRSCGCSSACNDTCRCSCHNQSERSRQCNPRQKTASNGNGRTQTVGMGQCEPTRILESYRLGVVQLHEECCPKFDRERYRNLLGWLWDFVPQDSLLGRVVGCFLCTADFLRDRITGTDGNALLVILGTQANVSPAMGNLTTQDLHRACCRFRQALIDLFQAGPFNVRCQLLHALDDIRCIAPGPDSSATAYIGVVQPAVNDLIGLLVQYLLDCICHAFIPVCSPDPEEKRLILACVTIRDNKILRICNFGCRSYAGAFPSLFYWLSAVPIVPILKCLITRLCCAPDLVRINSPVVNDLVKFIDRLDPTGELRTAFLEGGAALPRSFLANLNRVADNVTPSRLAEALRPGDINLSKLAGLKPDEARRVLAGAKVSVVERELAAEAELPVLTALTASPFASANETVVLYKKEDKVVGFGRYDASEQLRDTRSEVTGLRAELKELRDGLRRQKKPSAEPEAKAEPKRARKRRS
jgi:hypothetical protein